jgi:hypothetical protein
LPDVFLDRVDFAAQDAGRTMDKQKRVGKLDLEHVPPGPLLISASAPRLGREFIRPNGLGAAKLTRRGGMCRVDDKPPRIAGPMDLREIGSK